jgi:hypothetical protein
VDFEVGGYIDFETLSVVLQKQGSEFGKIASMEVHSYFDTPPRISLHTHFVNLTRQFETPQPNDENLIMLPSQIDLRTSVRSALYRTKWEMPPPSEELVLSKQTGVFFKPSDALIKALMMYTEEEQEDIIENFITENLGFMYYKLRKTKMSERESFAQFRDEVSQCFEYADRQTGEESAAGFDVFMMKFELDVPSDDQIQAMVRRMSSLPKDK